MSRLIISDNHRLRKISDVIRVALLIVEYKLRKLCSHVVVVYLYFLENLSISVGHRTIYLLPKRLFEMLVRNAR